MHDYQLVLKCLLTHNGGIFEKFSLAFLVKFLYYYVYHLNPRVKVICDPCDMILIILKDDYTTMLYTKNRDFWHSTFEEINILLLLIRRSYINGGHFEIQDGRTMLRIFSSHNLSKLSFYMLKTLCFMLK